MNPPSDPFPFLSWLAVFAPSTCSLYSCYPYHTGRLPERPMGADCKSVGLRLPRFESWTCHHAAAAQQEAGIVQPSHATSHRRVGGRPVGRHLAMLDQPRVAVGYQSVAIAADVVEPDMGHHREVAQDMRLVASHLGEQHVGDVVPDDRLDVGADGDVPRDTAEERDDLGAAAQRLEAAYLQYTVCAEGLGKFVEPTGVTGPVVSGEGVADVLAGDQFPHLHCRDPLWLNLTRCDDTGGRPRCCAAV